MDYKCVITTKDLGELLGCIRIYSIPSANQSVFRKDDFELIYRRRRDNVITLSLHCSNNSMSGGEKTSIGNI